MTKVAISAGILALVAVTVAGCETTRGFGEDMQRAGSRLSGWAAENEQPPPPPADRFSGPDRYSNSDRAVPYDLRRRPPEPTQPY
jgi:predicted small secreted protein